MLGSTGAEPDDSAEEPEAWLIDAAAPFVGYDPRRALCDVLRCSGFLVLGDLVGTAHVGAGVEGAVRGVAAARVEGAMC